MVGLSEAVFGMFYANGEKQEPNRPSNLHRNSVIRPAKLSESIGMADPTPVLDLDALKRDLKNAFNLACFAMSSSDYFKAKLNFERALHIRERIEGFDSIGIAKDHEMLGDTNRGIGDTIAAIDHYCRALGIIYRNKDGDDPSSERYEGPIEPTSIRVDDILSPEEDSESISIIESKLNDLESAVAANGSTSAYDMGCAYISGKHYLRAKKMLEKALHSENNEMMTAMIQEKLGDTKLGMRNKGHAINHYELALDILQESGKYSEILEIEAKLLNARGVQASQKTLRLQRDPDEPTDVDYIEGLENLSHGKFTEAQENFEESRMHHINQYDNNDYNIGFIEEKLGDVATGMKEYTIARDRYDAALSILHQNINDVTGGRCQKIRSVARILLSASEACLALGNLTLASKYIDDLPRGSFEDDRFISESFRRRISEHEEKARNEASLMNFSASFFHYQLATLLVQFYLTIVEIERQTGNSRRAVTIHGEEQKDQFSEFLKVNQDDTLKVFAEIVFVGGIGKLSFNKSASLSEQMKMATIMHNIGVYCERKNLIDEALGLYKKTLLIKRNIYGDNHIKVISTMTAIGNVYKIRGEDEEALRYFEDVLKILSSDDVCSDYRQTVFILEEIICISLKQKVLYKAVRYLKRKVELLKPHLGDYGSEIAATYTRLGSVHVKYDQPDEAMNYFDKAISVNQYLGRPINEAITTHKLGYLYFKLGRNEKAIECHKRVLQLKKEMDADKGDIAITLRSMGTCYFAEDRFDEALQSYKSAVDASGGIDKILTLNRIGVIHSLNRNHEQAMVYYRQAVVADKTRKNSGKDSIGYYLLNNTGSVYYASGNYTKAMDFYKKALALSSKQQSLPREAIRRTLNNMETLSMRSDYYNGNVQDFHEFSTAVCHLVDGNDVDVDVAIILHNIGVLRLQEGKHKAAIVAFEKSLQFKENALGSESEELVGTLANLGTTHILMDQSETALECLQRALMIVDKYGSDYGKNKYSLMVSSLLMKVGNVHAKKKVFHLAMKSYEKALELKLRVFEDDNHEEILTTRHNMGLILCKERRYDKALSTLQNVHRKKQDIYGDDNIEVAKLVLDMGSISYAKGDYFAAKKLCDEAMTIFKTKELNKRHPYMRQAKYTLEKLRHKKGVKVREAAEKLKHVNQEVTDKLKQITPQINKTRLPKNGSNELTK